MRQEYALFFAKCKRKKETEILAWHDRYLERPLTNSEIKIAKRNIRNRLRREIKINLVRLFTI